MDDFFDVPQTAATSLSRRQTLAALAGIGIGSGVLTRALAAEAEKGDLDADAIARAEWVAGVSLSDEQRQAITQSVNRLQRKLASLRAVELDADVPPCLHFHTAVSIRSDRDSSDPAGGPAVIARGRVAGGPLPTSDADIAHASLTTLGQLLRRRDISSLELTDLYLNRLHRYGPELQCVVTLTEDLARRQARRADRELAAGVDRGPLHGIPWGAKDLIAVPGYNTTWGAKAYRDQYRDQQATVANKLDEAGAVLVAKLTLGAYAMGDTWFGGVTRNPWDLEMGSSGSSAGSAAATVAGLVGFAIGSETLGSIVSPARRCGTSGLRPTFGRVSRFGCMPLAWSFDKIGPMGRSLEDCALVFAAIIGSDGLDPTVVDRPFRWAPGQLRRGLRVGYTGSRDSAELQTLEELGVTLVPIELPNDFPLRALTMMIDVESASMFYDLWKDGDEDGLFAWPRVWQAASFIPAIDYVRAARVRSKLLATMEEQIFSRVDAYIGGNDLVLANLTGHPTAVLPRWPDEPITSDQSVEQGSDDQDEADAKPARPGSVTFTGRLNDESTLLSLADAYQQIRGDHRRRPPRYANS